ncbi:MAG TPA: hypothetical protein VGE11_21645, partial [Pseudonocardia sp.]
MRATTSLTGDAVGFDGLRAVVGAGEGVVARFPGIVCVAQCRDPGPLRDFLALCASAGGPDPGRALARQLATWMTGSGAPGSELRFGTVAAAGEQMAVFLVGAVEVRVDGAGGVGGLTLSGAHAAIGTDRLFARPRTPVLLSLDGAQVRADPADVYDLQAGVVPGAGVLLHTATFDRDAPDSDTDADLAGHEWFDTDARSDASDQSPWSPDVPTQRTGERNGATHWPGMAEDDPWGGSAFAEPVSAVEVSSVEGGAGEGGAGEGGAGGGGAEEGGAGEGGVEDGADRNGAEGDGSAGDGSAGNGSAEYGGSFNGNRGGRHALLSSGDYGVADEADRADLGRNGAGHNDAGRDDAGRDDADRDDADRDDTDRDNAARNDLGLDDSELRASGPDEPDRGVADRGVADRDVARLDDRDRAALDPDAPYRAVGDPRDVEEPFESFFADLRNESRTPGLRTRDPRTGDPPRAAIAEHEADPVPEGPSQRRPADLGDAEPGLPFPAAGATGRDADRDRFGRP